MITIELEPNDPPPPTQKEIIINTLRDSVKENLMIRRTQIVRFLEKITKIFNFFGDFMEKIVQKLQNFPKFAHFPKISLFPRNIPISQLFHTCETGDPLVLLEASIGEECPKQAVDIFHKWARSKRCCFEDSCLK